jgi:NADP-reducing hydrogenase subunit HndB
MEKLTIKMLDEMRTAQAETGDWIKVGMSTCGLAAGAQEVYETLVDEIKKAGADVEVKKCGCLGMCYAEPLIEVKVSGMPTVVYCRVDREVAARIVDKHIMGKRLVNDYVIMK